MFLNPKPFPDIQQLVQGIQKPFTPCQKPPKPKKAVSPQTLSAEVIGLSRNPKASAESVWGLKGFWGVGFFWHG